MPSSANSFELHGQAQIHQRLLGAEQFELGFLQAASASDQLLARHGAASGKRLQAIDVGLLQSQFGDGLQQSALAWPTSAESISARTSPF